MNIRNGELYCFDKVVELNDDIVTYDINPRGCLYYTSDGTAHYIERSDLRMIRFYNYVDKAEILNVYLLGCSRYVLVFKNKFEFRSIRDSEIRTFEMRIEADFRLFKSYVYGKFCYLNGGILYTSDENLVCHTSEYKYICEVTYDYICEVNYEQTIVTVSYITYDDIYITQSYHVDDTPYAACILDNTTIKNVTKIRCTDLIEVYYNDDQIIVYCRATRHAICIANFKYDHFQGVPLEVWEFETNGHQWTISNGMRKYYYYDELYFEIPIEAQLYKSSRNIIPRVPTKSARF